MDDRRTTFFLRVTILVCSISSRYRLVALCYLFIRDLFLQCASTLLLSCLFFPLRSVPSCLVNSFFPGMKFLSFWSSPPKIRDDNQSPSSLPLDIAYVPSLTKVFFSVSEGFGFAAFLFSHTQCRFLTLFLGLSDIFS